MSNPFLIDPSTGFRQGDFPDPATQEPTEPFDPQVILGGYNTFTGENTFAAQTAFQLYTSFAGTTQFNGDLYAVGPVQFDGLQVKPYSVFDSDQFINIHGVVFRPNQTYYPTYHSTVFGNSVNFESSIYVSGTIYLNGEPVGSGGGGDGNFTNLTAAYANLGGSVSFDSNGMNISGNNFYQYGGNWATYQTNNSIQGGMFAINYDSGGAFYIGSGVNVSFFGATGQAYPGTVYNQTSDGMGDPNTIANAINNLHAILAQFGLVTIS